MRSYTSARPDLTRVQLRRDISDELRTDPQWQKRGLGARNDKAEQLVCAAFAQADQERKR